MKKFALAALALGLSMGTAHAADLIIPSDPIVDVASYSQDWNGFYAGVVGGWGSGTTSFTGAGPGVNVSTTGWLFGVTAGYNHQWNQFVLGVEGDIAWSNIGGSTVTGGGTLSTSSNWLGTFRGRAGVAFERALVYVTAGVAAAGVSSSFTGAGGGTFASSHTGWTAGAGLEYAVTDEWSVKAEYSYTALGTATAPAGTLVGAAAVNITPSFHAVKIGANFHF